MNVELNAKIKIFAKAIDTPVSTFINTGMGVYMDILVLDMDTQAKIRKIVYGNDCLKGADKDSQ